MSEARSARITKRRSRLIAVCTTGVLSLGALALGPAATAHADAAPHTAVARVAPKSADQPTMNLPQYTTGNRVAAAAGTTATARYDADGDGRTDLLFRSNDGAYHASLSATNTFQDIGSVDPNVRFKDVVTPGDLDGQPGGDILALTATGRLSLYSAGAFPTGTALWSGSGWQIYNKIFAPGDLNADGHPDLLARTPAGALYLYTGTGTGTAPFASRILVGSGWQGYDQLTGPGDLNADGHEDIVARDAGGNLYLYKGTGNAASAFASRSLIGSGWNAYNEIVGLGGEAAGAGALFGRTVSGDMYWYATNGAGNFNARVHALSGMAVDLLAGAGSNPNYGRKDLFGVTGDGTLYWYDPMNNGQLSSRQVISSPAGFSGMKVLGASSLGDNGNAALLVRDGDGLYDVDANDALISTGWTGYTLAVGPGDLNGDGRGDILARDSSGNLYLYPGRGDGAQLGARTKVGSGWNTYSKIIGGGDLTGDGRADLLARSTTGYLYLYKGTGSATTPFASRIQLGTGWNTYNKLAATGDMDGDGRGDIVAVNSTGELYRYSSTGTGTLKSRVRIGTSGWNTYTDLQ